MAAILSRPQCVNYNAKIQRSVNHKSADDKDDNHIRNKSSVKRLNTLGHLDQYIAQHGRIVKQSYCETV